MLRAAGLSDRAQLVLSGRPTLKPRERRANANAGSSWTRLTRTGGCAGGRRTFLSSTSVCSVKMRTLVRTSSDIWIWAVSWDYCLLWNLFILLLISDGAVMILLFHMRRVTVNIKAVTRFQTVCWHSRLVCKPLIVPPLLPQEVLKQLQSKLEQEAGTLASSGRSDVLHQLKGPNPSENRRLTFKSSRSVVLMEIRFSL